MASFLNPYCNFIDVLTKDNQMLLSNATDKFKSPMERENKISLWPRGKDYQKLKDNLRRLLQRFGYHYLSNNVTTICIVTPTIPAIVADATAGILAAHEVPALITYMDEIKIIEVYSDKSSWNLSEECFAYAGVKICLPIKTQDSFKTSMLTFDFYR
jgi:hypothetical protein